VIQSLGSVSAGTRAGAVSRTLAVRLDSSVHPAFHFRRSQPRGVYPLCIHFFPQFLAGARIDPLPRTYLKGLISRFKSGGEGGI
jgi:hypothetical protein